MNGNGMRYERKFAIRGFSVHRLRRMIELHPAQFTTPFPARYVNNIYLDSEDLASYRETLGGVAQRIKHRVRWYGDLLGHVEQPTYEIKRKRGLRGDKLSYRLKPFEFGPKLPPDDLLANIAGSTDVVEWKEELRGLRPWIVNRYHRFYYQSWDRRFRLTLDHGAESFRFAAPGRKYFGGLEGVTTVIELKYDVRDDDDVHAVTNAFPFRMTKNSKYVTGVYDAYCSIL